MSDFHSLESRPFLRRWSQPGRAVSVKARDKNAARLMEHKRNKKCPKHDVPVDRYCSHCTTRLSKPGWKHKCTGPKTAEIASPAEIPSPARTHARECHKGANYVASCVDQFMSGAVIRDHRRDKGVRDGIRASGTGCENHEALQIRGACVPRRFVLQRIIPVPAPHMHLPPVEMEQAKDHRTRKRLCHQLGMDR